MHILKEDDVPASVCSKIKLPPTPCFAIVCETYNKNI
jgi:hypothetical protein